MNDVNSQPCRYCGDRLDAVEGKENDVVLVESGDVRQLAHRCCVEHEGRVFQLAYANAAAPEHRGDFVKSKFVLHLNASSSGTSVIELSHPFSLRVRCPLEHESAVGSALRQRVEPNEGNVYDTAILSAQAYCVVKVALPQSARAPAPVIRAGGPILYFQNDSESILICWRLQNGGVLNDRLRASVTANVKKELATGGREDAEVKSILPGIRQSVEGNFVSFLVGV